MATFQVTKEKTRSNSEELIDHIHPEVLPSEDYSAKTMPHLLGSLDLTAIYVSIIFFITNVNTAVGVGGGAATFTYWILGAVTFFIPCAIATAQLAVMFPYEGSLYNWTHRAFGGYWSFFVAFCAWFPGVLLITSACGVVVSIIQGLTNNQWLALPWQQGIVLIVLVCLSGVLASQRFRTIQNIDNVILGVIILAVFLVVLAGVIWLAKGNQPVTSFSRLSDWTALNPGTFALFGITIQAYLGIEAPLNMGGELADGQKGRRAITRHLLWGTMIVIVAYMLVTFALLTVEGGSNGSLPYSLVDTVAKGLNSFLGDLVAVCIMCSFIVAPAVYNYTFARLLLVAGIDQRLPANIGKLNKHRVPVNAIFFQTVIAVIFAIVAYLVVPYVGRLGDPANLSAQVYNVVLAASTLVWSISTGFLLLNLARFYFVERQRLREHLIFPMPVLWISIVLGSASSLLAIIGTLFYSWIPSLISNAQWWYIIGGITVICLVVAAIGSMLASSEAAWQELNK